MMMIMRLKCAASPAFDASRLIIARDQIDDDDDSDCYDDCNDHDDDDDEDGHDHEAVGKVSAGGKHLPFQPLPRQLTIVSPDI